MYATTSNEGFAALMQQRLRAATERNSTIEYTGNGWFSMRLDSTLPPDKMRGRERVRQRVVRWEAVTR